MSTEAASRAERPRRNRAPEFTERDAAALLWLGEQYGATLDVLGVLLGRLGDNDGPLSRWGVRNQVQRWQRSGLVSTERVLGDMWVTPTRRGLDRAGLNMDIWPIPATRVRHCHAVNIVRLAYEGGANSGRWPWISERVTRKERGKAARWHIPDGVLRDPDTDPDSPPRYVAIEVELTHKSRRAYAAEVFGNLRAGVIAVSYFVPDDTFRERLSADIRAAQVERGSTVRYSIELLPEVPGLSYKLER